MGSTLDILNRLGDFADVVTEFVVMAEFLHIVEVKAQKDDAAREPEHGVAKKSIQKESAETGKHCRLIDVSTKKVKVLILRVKVLRFCRE